MVTETLEIPAQAKQLIAETEVVVAQAQAFTIATITDYQLAGMELKVIKGRMKELDDLRKSLTRPLDEAKKRIMALFTPAEDRLKKAENLIKRAMLGYQQEQERKRQEEEARLRKIAEDEQRRRDALAAKQAEKARARGNEERAQEILENVPIIPTPVVLKEQPKVKGIATREIWKFRVVNVSLLPREYMLPNGKMLLAFAQATKGTIPVPGVEFYSEEIVAAGR